MDWRDSRQITVLHIESETMLKTFKLLAILTCLAVLLPACATQPKRLMVEEPDFRLRNAVPEDVVLVVKGEPGQQFSGKLMLDGVPAEINGETPVEIDLRAQVITGTVRKIGGRGHIGFDIIHGEPKRAASFGGLNRRGDRVRFGYHAGAVESVFGF